MTTAQFPTDPEIKADYWADAPHGNAWLCRECDEAYSEGAVIAKHMMTTGHSPPKLTALPSAAINTLTETARLRDALKASLQALDLAIEVATQAGAPTLQISILHNLHTAIRVNL